MKNSFLALLCLSFVIGCACIEPTSSTKPVPVGQMLVSIKGDVHNPGNYFLHEGANLADALQQAGDFTDFAYLKKVKITHRDGNIVYCNFREDGRTFILAEGDTVFIDSIGSTF